mmetsp:Transcript_22144/g.37499  ORF Transcript_22144/g.37499 Transcript_22144/m.37499 type:complete len:299 (-) Transcript_22144:511-1407(-)
MSRRRSRASSARTSQARHLLLPCRPRIPLQVLLQVLLQVQPQLLRHAPRPALLQLQGRRRGQKVLLAPEDPLVVVSPPGLVALQPAATSIAHSALLLKPLLLLLVAVNLLRYMAVSAHITMLLALLQRGSAVGAVERKHIALHLQETEAAEGVVTGRGHGHSQQVEADGAFIGLDEAAPQHCRCPRRHLLTAMLFLVLLLPVLLFQQVGSLPFFLLINNVLLTRRYVNSHMSDLHIERNHRQLLGSDQARGGRGWEAPLRPMVSALHFEALVGRCAGTVAGAIITGTGTGTGADGGAE